MDIPTLQVGGWGRGHGCHEQVQTPRSGPISHAPPLRSIPTAPGTFCASLLLAMRPQTEDPASPELG